MKQFIVGIDMVENGDKDSFPNAFDFNHLHQKTQLYLVTISYKCGTSNASKIIFTKDKPINTGFVKIEGYKSEIKDGEFVPTTKLAGFHGNVESLSWVESNSFIYTIDYRLGNSYIDFLK